MLHAAVLLISVATAQSEPPVSGDWRQYNFDNRGWRHNAAESTLSPQNVGSLEVKWSFPESDESVNRIGKVHATPTVVDHHVYFSTATEPAIYCLRPDGTRKWKYENLINGKVVTRGRRNLTDDARELVSGGFYNAVLVQGDSLFATDTSGFVYCLAKETGVEKWKLDLREMSFPLAHPKNQSMGSPILAGGRLIVGGGAYEHDLGARSDYECCTGRGFVIALNPKTGELLWQFALGTKPERLDPPFIIEDSRGRHVFHYGPATSSVWSTPSYDAESQTLFFGTDTNNSPRRPTKDDPRLHTEDSCAIVALDGRTGVRKWVTQLNPGDVWNYAIRAYDPQTGRYRDCSIGDTPKIYMVDVEDVPTKVVGVGCKNGGYYVLNAANGRIHQQTPVYAGLPTLPPSPIPDPRMLAFPGVLGGLQTGCATDGRSVFVNGVDWLTGILVAKRASPRLDPPTGGRVTSISRDTRRENWRFETPGTRCRAWPGKEVGDPVASGIAVANSVVYFTTMFGGKLFALDAATGQRLYVHQLPDLICGPSVSQGRVYVGTGSCVFSFHDSDETGRVYCFGLPD